MNVSLKNNDAVSGVLKVEIEKNDYADLVDKNLQKLRKQVNMPGFRKGMVPFSIVKKLYGKHAVAEEVNKLVLEKLRAYIRDNDVKVLGEPILKESEQMLVDFDTDENMEFCFDVALSPEIGFKLTKEDKITYYQTIVDDAMVDEQIDSYCKNLGSYDKVDKVEETDLVKGVVAELESGEPKAGGILVEEAVLMPSYLKEETEQKKFIGAELNSKIVFNPYKAYNGVEVEIASFLKIDEEKVKETKSDFAFEINEITRYKPAELNQEFFDRIYGQDVVKDEAEFRNKVRETLSRQFLSESDYRFMQDVRVFLVRKVDDVAFAEDILKRWLFLANDKTTREQVDNDYPKVIEDLKYHFAKDKLVEENNVKVEAEEVEAYARRLVKVQFAQYGLTSIPDDLLEDYTKEMLGKEDTVRNLVNRILNEKISSLVKKMITVEVKEVTAEEFGKIEEEAGKVSEDLNKMLEEFDK
jgi:trigger factor